MSSIPTTLRSSDGTWGVASGSQGMLRFGPEPRSGGSWVASATKALAGVAAAAFAPTGLGAAAGGIAGVGNIPADAGLLLAEQVRIQREMQIVTMISNVEKSKHETEMAPVRNLRVG
jgi:hypothetical protein